MSHKILKCLKIFMLAGVLLVLDAHPEGIIYQDLIPRYARAARTLYEGSTSIFDSGNYVYLCINLKKYINRNFLSFARVFWGSRG